MSVLWDLIGIFVMIAAFHIYAASIGRSMGANLGLIAIAWALVGVRDYIVRYKSTVAEAANARS